MSKLDSLFVKKDSILENKGRLYLIDGVNSSLINSSQNVEAFENYDNLSTL